MGRLGRSFIAPAVLCLATFGCGDDGAAGGGTETETGTGTAGSTGDASNSSPTATNPTATNSTMSGSSGTDPTMPTTGVDSSGGATDTGATDTGSATDSGGDDCEACIAGSCGDELAACAADVDCTCWVDCIGEGNDQMTCFGTCGAPPMLLGDIADCIDMQCDMECNGGGGTTTGGMTGDGTYDMCMDPMDCAMDTECNNFVGYCSVQCMGDDNNCPAPPDGDTTPECSNFSDNCILPCGNGETCPTGMSCVMAGPNELCAFN